jgi:hypothetical protein
MVQGLSSSVVDESPGIGDDSTGGTADMLIDFEYFLYAFGYD